MNGDVNYVKSSPAFEIRLPARRTLVGLKRLRTTYTSTCEMAHYLLLFSLSPTSNNESCTSLGRMRGSAHNLAHASLETAVKKSEFHVPSQAASYINY